MLVFLRRQGESIVIDDRIQVRIKRISKQRVSLLIDAPDHVAVDRQEIWLKKQADGLCESLRSTQ